MKIIGLILISILSLSFSQDRSTIFNAGPPQGSCEGDGCEELVIPNQCAACDGGIWVESGYLGIM